MVALGPRVGGAHVDVNMKFDDKSLARVGKKIHQQLSKFSDNLAKIGEQNQRIYQAIGRDSVVAWRSLLGTVLTGAPLIGSALSGVAGAAVALGGAFYSLAQSTYGAAPLITAIGIAAGTAFLGMKSFFSALKSGDLEGLTPSAKAAAKAVQSLSDAWGRVRDTVQENIFAGLADDIRRLSETLLPVLEKGLGKMGTALNGLAQSLLDYVNSSQGLKQINDLLNNSADIFARFSKAVVPALDGLLKLLSALAPAGKRLADRITDVAERFQSWASAPGFAERIDTMMRRAEKTAGLLFQVLGNLGRAIANIFNAANPATNTFLQMLIDVTQRFEDWTASVGGKNAIADWAMSSVDVMRQFGHTLEAVFKVLAELADPRVVISFLKTLEGAFEYLAKLPLDKMVDGFVRITEALQPISSLFLAIIIAAASFNIVIGLVVGQLGGLFLWLGKISKPLSNLFKPLASAGKHGKELTGLAAAFGRVFSFVSRFAKFIPFVGWGVWIGTVIAKSKDLQAKFGEVWDAVKGVGSSLMGAFKEIGAALQPLSPVADGVGTAFGFIFDILDKLLGLAIGVFLDMVVYGFKSLGNVIKGAGKIIAGLINVLVGLFTLDFGKMWDGLKQIVSGLGPLLKGAFGLFVTFFAPAKLAKLGLGAIKGLGSGIAKALPALAAVIGRLLAGALSAVARFGGMLLRGALSAVTTVFRAVGAYFVTVLKTYQTIFTTGWKVILGVFKAALKAVRTAVSTAFKFIRTTISNTFKTIRTVVKTALTFIVNVIKKGFTTARDILKNVGQSIIQVLSRTWQTVRTAASNAWNKVKELIRSAWTGIKNIVTTGVSNVVEAFKSIPGKILGVGKKFLDAGKTLMGKVFEGIQQGAKAAGGFIAGLAASMTEAFKKAVNGVIDLLNNAIPNKLGWGKLSIDLPDNPIPHLARGTNNFAGGVAMVGEEGPELVQLPKGSRVIPNRKTERMIGRAGATPVGGSQVVVNQNYYGPTTGRDRMREIEWALKFATRSRGMA